jgi:hypothetical protein
MLLFRGLLKSGINFSPHLALLKLYQRWDFPLKKTYVASLRGLLKSGINFSPHLALLKLYQRWDSNPHDVAITGF